MKKDSGQTKHSKEKKEHHVPKHNTEPKHVQQISKDYIYPEVGGLHK